MTDFFDQNTGNEEEEMIPAINRPDGATILVNGSYQRIESGAPFLQSVKTVAAQAGMGKFRVWLNGTEVRPTSAPENFTSEMNVELKPYDEAG